MSTLDLPQHVYVCADCRRPAPTGECREHPGAGVYVTPTLLHADFVAFTQACRLAGRRIPGDDAIWDRLESHSDTAGTNREAIENAIKAVQAVSEIEAEIRAAYRLPDEPPRCPRGCALWSECDEPADCSASNIGREVDR